MDLPTDKVQYKVWKGIKCLSAAKVLLKIPCWLVFFTFIALFWNLISFSYFFVFMF